MPPWQVRVPQQVIPGPQPLPRRMQEPSSQTPPPEAVWRQLAAPQQGTEALQREPTAAQRTFASQIP